MCNLTTEFLDNATLKVVLSGDLLIGTDTPDPVSVIEEIKSLPGLKTLKFDTDRLTSWDSTLLTFLLRISTACAESKIVFDKESLPAGIQRLLNLAAAVPERKGSRKQGIHPSFFEIIGGHVLAFIQAFVEILVFLGEVCTACAGLLKGKSSFSFSMVVPILRNCSVDALPIVSLISCLVGLILAFVGAVQLVMFGAQIYVASLVGIAMIRVMGAVMAGVIMAGRTGAAFAAQLGTMEVNEEIDALKTLGISPIEFLVMPRLVALGLAMPLLCLYADLMGILGGMIVGIFMLDLNLMEYYNMTRASVSLNSFWIGLFQSVVFGILVAMAGCLRGMQCKRSASAVGDAATSAVVTGIVAIVIATAIITLLCNVLGI